MNRDSFDKTKAVFSMFGAGITKPEAQHPHKNGCIRDVLERMFCPEMMMLTDELRSIDDEKMQKQFKADKLPFVTFSGTFSYRKEEGLVQHSGLICFDVDHLQSADEVTMVREQLRNDPHFTTELMFTSPRGLGVKWVTHIDMERASHKAWYQAIANYLLDTYNIKVDSAPQNVASACFLCHDPEVESNQMGEVNVVGLESFNLEKFLHTKQEHQASASISGFDGATDSDQIHALVDEVVRQGIDLTKDYENWLKVGFALKDALGEEGRQLFHRLSSLYPNYGYAECDSKYSSIMKSHGDGVHIATLFHLAKDSGVNIGEVAREFCATSAKAPSGRNMEKRVKINNSGIMDKNTPSGGMAKVAQSTFSDQLRREDFPSFLHPVWDSQTTAAGRDKMMLGVLNMVSGLMPDALYGIYDRRKVYAALYNIVFGGFATLKGELEVVKLIAAPVKQEMRARYEAQKNEYEQALADWETQGKKERGPRPQAPALCSPFVSANSSASAVYRGMDANGGFGIMFETEADTLTNMLSKSEYGDYSDLLRKAHHHETISMVRVSDQINIEIEKPRLSVFLTCTGSQLPQLLPANNVANGLASRFLFYALPDSKVEFRNVFDGCDNPIEDVYRDMGNRFLPLYHELLRRGERLRPLQFVMSKAQQEEFVQSFDAVLREQFAMLGDGIQGFIFRLALECYRYAMVLTVLRRLSDWDGRDTIFDDDEQALVCDDLDFHTAMVIVNCLVNHTGRVYAVLATQDKDPFSKAAEQPSDELRRYYDALPQGEFKTATALKVSKSLSIPERTAQRLLGDMVTKFLVLQHPRQGVYVKDLTDSTAVSSSQTASLDTINSIVTNPKQHSYENDR